MIVGDPFSIALQNLGPELNSLSGGTFDIEVVGYDDMRLLALRNAQDQVSAYDIVSFDVVWIGEFATEGVLLPLNIQVTFHLTVRQDP